MGKGGSVTIGYWYHLAYHHGISGTPIDAFLEFRGGDKVAWSGELTSSGTIIINQPNLWGGAKDQGGIVSPFELMFGDDNQQPNDYLRKVFGDQVPGWRGVTTAVLRGGRYGAMNPYPQKPAYKIRVIKKGWDDDACWYPETAEVPAIQSGQSLEISYAKTTDNVYVQTAGIPLPPLDPDPASYSTVASGSQVSWATGQGQTGVMWVHIALPDGTPNSAVINVMVAWDDSGRLIGQQDLLVSPGEPGAPVSGYPSRAGYRVSVAPGKRSGWLAFACTDALDVDTGAGLGSTSRHGMRISSVQPGNSGYMNPAHVLYEARTARDRGAEPIESMADASWRRGADWYAAQSFGVCTEFDPDSETVDDFIARIERVAGCSVNRSPIDGLWYLDIANGVYDLASLPVLTDDDILDWERKPTLSDDAVNSLSVEYFDVEQKTTVTTPPVRALAFIAANGLNHEVRQFHELPTAELAGRVADRELNAVVTPAQAFSLTTTRKPHAWRRYTYFRLQAPKIGVPDMVCLLAEKSSGTLKSGAMKITATQDIYSLASAPYAEAEVGVDTRPSPIPVTIAEQVVFEAPYIDVVRQLPRTALAALPDDVGFAVAIAADPSTSRDFTMTVSTDGGTTYRAVADGPWCPTAMVVEGDELVDAAPATHFTLADGALLDQVIVGQAALWGSEIVRVDAIDTDAGTLTLGRGCADTVASPHAEQSRIWFYDGFTAADRTEYTDGETVRAKLLSNTGSAQLDPALATVQTVDLQGRLLLPYPPGKLRIAGAAYPSTVSGAFTVTWTHRNRVTQADQLLDSEAASVTPADNQRYHLQLLDVDDQVLVERDDIGPGSATVTLAYTGQVTLTLQTLDPYGGSLQVHRVTFGYTPASPAPPASMITATAYTPVDNSVVFDGGGEPL